MGSDIRFEPFTRDNWEEALKLEVLPEQKKFTPTVAEGLDPPCRFDLGIGA